MRSLLARCILPVLAVVASWVLLSILGDNVATTSAAAARDRGRSAGFPLELVSAQLSPDGMIAAVDGPAEHGMWRISLVDVRSGRLVTTSPEGWFSIRHRWGAGTAYVETRGSPSNVWSIYYAPFARSPVTRVEIPHVSSRVIQPSETALDPHNRWLIVAAHFRDFVRVLAVSLPSARRVTTLWESKEYVEILGVTAVPGAGDETLVLLGGFTEGPGNRPGVLAVSCPTGSSLSRVRWRVRIPEWPVFFGQMGVVDSSKAILPARTGGVQDMQAGAKPKSVVWLIDLRKGSLDGLAILPTWRADWAAGIPRKRRDGVLIGTDDGIWLLPVRAGVGPGVPIVREAVQCWPAGVTEAPTGGVELYLATRNCLWRCLLRDRTVKAVYGTPQKEDQAPQIVASDAMLESAGLR